MSKYMINIHYGDLNKRKESGRDMEFIMGKYQEWSEKIASKTLFAHKLKDNDGRKLELNGEQFKDGPYVETKEGLGGFYIVEAENYEEALEISKGCPTLLYQGGYVEVREVEF